MAKDKSDQTDNSSSDKPARGASRVAAQDALKQARSAGKSGKSGKSDKSDKSAGTERSRAVQRAASSASLSRSSSLRNRWFTGFPALLAVIFILGGLLVAYAYASRDASLPPRQNEDHWHSPYVIWDCVSEEDGGFGGFVGAFTSSRDENGIHSHADGIIHIHPFRAFTAGSNATMSEFLNEMGRNGNDASISEEAIVLDDGRRLEAGVECNGEPSIIQIARWRRLTQLDRDPVIYTEDLGNVRFLADGEAFTLARAPVGAEIPPPPPERIDLGNQLTPNTPLDFEGTDDGSVVPSATTTTTASDSTTTTAPDATTTTEAG